MPLSHLGETRSSRKHDHILQTPDTFIRAALPGMQKCLAIVHCGPASGAGFTQYTAEMQSRGTLGRTTGQRFTYVLDGGITVAEAFLGPGSFAFIPQGEEHSVEAVAESRVIVIEKRYVPMPDRPVPAFFTGSEHDTVAKPLAGDEDISVRSLVPDHTGHDFAVNTLSYLPGASLPLVELHIMEHGLFMLTGSGIYRLGDSWYPVAAGDFIWMAPYCPQWFGALGKARAKYLLYKDWNRHPL